MLTDFQASSNELIEINGKQKTRYQWTQEQRRVETAIRYQKDEANLYKASGDDLARRKAQQNINSLQAYYKKISREAGLYEDKNRMSVSGYRRVKTVEELKNPAKNGIIISGALDANSKEASKHAKQYYEAVRKMRTDVQRIAKNTGWKETAIKKIKDHIFFAEHDIYGEMRRFDPSYHMAETWQRLINGGKEIQEQDCVLLKHEYLEQLLEDKGYTHDKAHTIASAKHDYAKYTK